MALAPPVGLYTVSDGDARGRAAVESRAERVNVQVVEPRIKMFQTSVPRTEIDFWCECAPGEAVQDEGEGRDDATGADLGADDAPGVGQLAGGEVPQAAPDVGPQAVAQAEGGDQKRRLLVGEADQLQPHGQERHRLQRQEQV